MGLKRLQQLLELNDFVHPGGKNTKSSSSKTIEIVEATLAWEVEERTSKKLEESPDRTFVNCLFDLNLSVGRWEGLIHCLHTFNAFVKLSNQENQICEYWADCS